MLCDAGAVTMYDGENIRPGGRALLLETRAIYRLADAAYAPFSCPSSSECCQLTQRQRQPWLWPSEWKLLEDAAIKQWGTLPKPRPDGGCPFLDENGKRCRVYELRPLGCRTYFCHRKSGPSKEPIETMVTLSKRLEFINLQANADLKGPTEILTLLANASPRE